MSFDRVKWFNETSAEVAQEGMPAEWADRILVLALLADDDGFIATADFEAATGLPAGSLREKFSDGLRLLFPVEAA